ncbi:hypothetical protein F4775DRAFT_531990 [Biscogniauxia sp. FL1348]|nr:hypothetical protein F4775DRAFT_531990 [Biscogniauxia sp. FL1348]
MGHDEQLPPAPGYPCVWVRAGEGTLIPVILPLDEDGNKDYSACPIEIDIETEMKKQKQTTDGDGDGDGDGNGGAEPQPQPQPGPQPEPEPEPEPEPTFYPLVWGAWYGEGPLRVLGRWGFFDVLRFALLVPASVWALLWVIITTLYELRLRVPFL